MTSRALGFTTLLLTQDDFPVVYTIVKWRQVNSSAFRKWFLSNETDKFRYDFSIADFNTMSRSIYRPTSGRVV